MTFHLIQRNGRVALSLSVALLMMLGLAVSVAGAKEDRDDKDKDWKVLGEAKVEKRAESDEIKVGGGEGVFKRIKLEVRGADVKFKKMTIKYESGDDEEVEVRDEVKRGEQTRPIDLKGGNRAIKKVIFVYKAEGDTDRGARVVLLGNK
jgi:hypothetical protein